jgi:hypothetical protein
MCMLSGNCSGNRVFAFKWYEGVVYLLENHAACILFSGCASQSTYTICSCNATWSAADACNYAFRAKRARYPCSTGIRLRFCVAEAVTVTCFVMPATIFVFDQSNSAWSRWYFAIGRMSAVSCAEGAEFN